MSERPLPDREHHRAGGSPCDVGSSLIVGLGNPGRKYAGNRHNIGFQCVDRLAEGHAICLSKSRFKARYGEGRLDDCRIILAKPLTYMNSSGEAVGPLSRWYKIPPERVLVIHDDLDLPLARVRLRSGGSSGGHHGIASVIEHLGTCDFPRLRIGIGRPQCGEPTDYVLNDFTLEQGPVIQATLELVDEIVLCFLRRGIREAMNTYNNSRPLPGSSSQCPA